MPDNGFGAKATSKDFLIRAYYIKVDFKTASGGTGGIEVRDFISFSDPDDKIGFTIVNESTTDRLLTSGDIDPESMQVASQRRLLDGRRVRAVDSPLRLHRQAARRALWDSGPEASQQPVPRRRGPHPAQQPRVRGHGDEPEREVPLRRARGPGPTVADTDQRRRYIYEFSTVTKALTGQSLGVQGRERRVDDFPDMFALDSNRIVMMERDGGLGLTAIFRNVYVLDLRDVGSDGFIVKNLALDMTAIPDPDSVSLPAIHAGDIGLGNPFRVVCESVEAIYPLDGVRVMIGCDNNIPNKGRNPNLADDNEIIVVKIPGMKSIK